MWQESTRLLHVLALRQCPNQQKFYFDSEEWGHCQRESDKSSVLTCPFFFNLEFSINKTQIANIVGCNKYNTVAFQDVLVMK